MRKVLIPLVLIFVLGGAAFLVLGSRGKVSPLPNEPAVKVFFENKERKVTPSVSPAITAAPTLKPTEKPVSKPKPTAIIEPTVEPTLEPTLEPTKEASPTGDNN